MKASEVSARHVSAAERGNEEVPGGQVKTFTPYAPPAERRESGKKLREACPRNSHGAWKPPSTRPDPVDLVLQADKGRVPELVPLRHGRMVQSPFTFYRGAALNMAADLAATPYTGIRVQCGGDCHLANFGGFATPERRVIFAVNDLDETLPAPWEWDLKRLSASFVIASRENGLGESTAYEMARLCARSYRERMAEFSAMKPLDLWYFALEVEAIIAGIKDADIRGRAISDLSKSFEESFPKVEQSQGGLQVIAEKPPTIFHWKGFKPGEIHPIIAEAFDRYRDSVGPARRTLLDRYQVRDAAVKVVGIGSVGTVCCVLLLISGDGDHLFLQVKEARPSVLEAYAGPSVFPNHGQRVVNGHWLMQPASDIFLGWTQDKAGRHFYVRQLKDVKIKFAAETFGKAEMSAFAECCGYSLALSHARSGDSALISGYMGNSEALDEAVAAFSVAYADQNEQDHDQLRLAVRTGKIKVEFDRATAEAHQRVPALALPLSTTGSRADAKDAVAREQCERDNMSGSKSQSGSFVDLGSAGTAANQS